MQMRVRAGLFSRRIASLDNKKPRLGMQMRVRAGLFSGRIASLNDEKLRLGMQMRARAGLFSGRIASLTIEKKRLVMQMRRFRLHLRQPLCLRIDNLESDQSVIHADNCRFLCTFILNNKAFLLLNKNK